MKFISILLLYNKNICFNIFYIYLFQFQSDYYNLFKKPSDIFVVNWTELSNKIVRYALKKE